MKFLKGISILSAVCIALSSAAAAHTLRIDKRLAAKRGLATDSDIFLHDYLTDKMELSEYGYTYNRPANCDVKIETITDEGNERTVLALIDGAVGTSYSGPNLTIKFPTVSRGKVGFKTRFKMIPLDNTHAGMRIYMNNEKSSAANIKVTSIPSGNIQLSDDVNNINLSPSRIEQDIWYTATLIIDLDKKTMSALLESDSMINPTRYDDLPLSAAFDSGYGLSSILITAQQYGAKWYFDYIQMTENPKPLKKVVKVHPPEIAPPVSETPAAHTVSGRINVDRNGIYYYFTYPPVLKDGDVYVTARSLFNIFCMNMKIENEKFTGEKNGRSFEINTDGSCTKVNSTDISSHTFMSGGQLFVNLNKAAELFGAEAVWDEAANTIYLKDGEA